MLWSIRPAWSNLPTGFKIGQKNRYYSQTTVLSLHTYIRPMIHMTHMSRDMIMNFIHLFLLKKDNVIFYLIFV